MSASKIADERIYRTEDGRYVSEGDPDAAFLAAAVGDPLPDDYEGTKATKQPANKAAKQPDNKQA